MKNSKVKRNSMIFVIVIIALFVLLSFYYKEINKPEPYYYLQYQSIRMEYVGDKDTYKYSNNLDLLIGHIDGIKKSSIKTNEVFEDEWIYKIIIGYNSDMPDTQRVEILIKSHSITIDGEEYVCQSQEVHENVLDSMKAWYEHENFNVYDK